MDTTKDSVAEINTIRNTAIIADDADVKIEPIISRKGLNINTGFCLVQKYVRNPQLKNGQTLVNSD